MALILDLPVDIITLILPYLDARSYLNVTATCKAFHHPSFVYDAAYWSNCVRQDFRVPNQPVVQHDGRRWQSLYRRLLRESRIYTWGSNEKACLGHADVALDARGLPIDRGGRRRPHVSWPCPMAETSLLGVIADLQCGGWSTTMLTATGVLYTVGVLDGMQPEHLPATRPTSLKYPVGFPPSRTRYEPSTAITQFSAGRAHVLALADSGSIWSWWNWQHAAVHVKLLHHDVREDGRRRGPGAVRKVIAGWNKSSALIDGVGIVVWEPLKLESSDIGFSDAVLVLESQVVPKTGHSNLRTQKNGRTSNMSNTGLATSIGEVDNFVLLEDVVLFCTSLGKAFAAHITWDRDHHSISEPVELLSTLHVTKQDSSNADSTFVTDVQGFFRSFAVFLRSGVVLTGEQSDLVRFITVSGSEHGENMPASSAIFKRIPALQHSNVISIAFGDYHFHALHASGHITSYGTEPGGCGALGLCGRGNPEGRLRGIRYAGRGGDGSLVPHAYTQGRRVWFEKEKRDWIQFLTSGGVDPQEAAERMRMAIGSPGIIAQAEVSEWIEQEGRDWEGKLGLVAEDGLPAHFVLSVAAAGWHSGALVLVNEELAGKLSAACEITTTPGADAQIEIEAYGEDGDGADTATSTTLSTVSSRASFTGLAWLLEPVLDFSRYFLGIAPYDNISPTMASADHGRGVLHYDQSSTRPSQSYGASPRSGVSYLWAKHSFPRLQLSDGTEMPGTVAFDKWRFGRPEWKLDWNENSGNGT